MCTICVFHRNLLNLTQKTASLLSMSATLWMKVSFLVQISRGRVNHDIYALMENGINNVIDEQSKVSDGLYYIDKGSVLTADDDEISNAGNAYFTFIKSFIVVIDKQSV